MRFAIIHTLILMSLFIPSMIPVLAGPSYDDLQRILNDKNNNKNEELIKQAVGRYQRDALNQNQEKGKKTGNLRRIIYLLSKNKHKTREFEKNLDRYGIEVFRAPVLSETSESPESPEAQTLRQIYLNAILNLNVPSIQVLAAVQETSKLRDTDSHEDQTENKKWQEKKRNAQMTSLLEVYYLGLDESFQESNSSITSALPKTVPKVLQEKKYAATARGILDPSRKIAQLPSNGSNVFGWDDIFILPGLSQEYTYHDLKSLGHKVSPRDQVLAHYIRDFIYYKKMDDLKYNAVNPGEVIDFGNSVGSFIEKVRLYNLPLVKEYGIYGLFDSVINEGVFFRAALNRREKNYWLPGLNAGIPFTKKNDEIHELTYLTHDLGHFAIRDLIYTGTSDPRHRQIYIAYRMMSEAITMVFADMLFVDALKLSGEDYDFSKRAIYPLFQSTGLSFQDPQVRLQNFIQLIRANVAYCLRGDDTVYRKLISRNQSLMATQNGDPFSALLAFESKYMPFMVEDFRWTDRNYANMSSHADEMSRWWQSVSPLQNVAGIQFETLEQFAEKMDDRDGDLVDQILAVVIRDQIIPVFSGQMKPSHEQERLKKGFVRYLAGQMGIFEKYQNLLPQLTQQYRKRLIEAAEKVLPEISLAGVREVRAIYDEYLAELQEHHLISPDDLVTYSAVYPLFEPFFVSYDQNKDTYEDLRVVAQRILKGPDGDASKAY